MTASDDSGSPFRPNTSFLPICSLLKLEQMAAGNKAFVEQMVKVSMVELPLAASEMRTHFLAGEIEEIGKVAHRIKPSMDILDVHSLKDVVRELEALSKTDPQSPKIKSMIAQVERDLAEVVDLLRMMYGHL